MAQRHHAQATALFQESLTIRREQGERRGIAECFDGLATAAAARRQPEGAVWAARHGFDDQQAPPEPADSTGTAIPL